MSPLHTRFRAKLLEAMNAAGLTQADLARRMGVSRQYVCNYVRGHDAEPTLSTIERFAEALSIPALTLLDETDILATIEPRT